MSAASRTGDATLMDALFGSSSGSDGSAEEDAGPQPPLLPPPQLAVAATTVWQQPMDRTAVAAAAAAEEAAAVASAAATSSDAKRQHRCITLATEPLAVGAVSSGGCCAEAEPEQQQLLEYDDGSVAATMFRQWPLVALAQLGDVGGGRGVITTRDVTAGTVLMSEAPFLPRPAGGWSSGVGANLSGLEQAAADYEDAALHTAAARHLLAGGLWRCPEMVELHPQTLESPHMSPEQLRRAWDSHEATVDLLIARLAIDTNDSATTEHSPTHGAGGLDPRPYTREEVLRCICQVQFNAFDSGMYLGLAMINHACDPNCCKFTPPPPPQKGGEGEGDLQPVAAQKSEIVAVVDIPRGTEITIHYANPPQRSHRARAELFAAQHYFSLGPTPFARSLDGPVGQAEWPVVKSVERDLENLEAMMHGDSGDDDGDPDVKQRFFELAEDCLSRASTLGVLPLTHLVVVRAHLAVVASAQRVIGAAVDVGRDTQGVVAVALRALRSCLAITQSEYLLINESL